MTWVNSYRLMQLALGLMALVVTIDSPRIHAQPATVVSHLRFVPPQPPDQGAAGGRRRGAASRCNNCPDLQLTALVPGDSQERSLLALTVDTHPTFWIYIPQAVTSELSGEFVLQDAADNKVYETAFTTPRTPEGIVSITLPQKTAPLEIGKQYYWTFWIYSDPKAASGNVAVHGLIQRVVPNSQRLNALKQGTPQDRTALYAAYADNGIWYDALTTLAQLRRQNPQDAKLTADWVSLLHSVGLNNIASKPGTEFQSQFPTKTYDAQ